MEATKTLADKTKAARKSVAQAEMPGTAGYYHVPIYDALPGYSVDEAAKSLGLRVLNRSERIQRDDVLAEIRDAPGGRGFPCVRA